MVLCSEAASRVLLALCIIRNKYKESGRFVDFVVVVFFFKFCPYGIFDFFFLSVCLKTASRQQMLNCRCWSDGLVFMLSASEQETGPFRHAC